MYKISWLEITICKNYCSLFLDLVRRHSSVDLADKTFAVFFNWSNWERLVHEISKFANWWKHSDEFITGQEWIRHAEFLIHDLRRPDEKSLTQGKILWGNCMALRNSVSYSAPRNGSCTKLAKIKDSYTSISDEYVRFTCRHDTNACVWIFDFSYLI